MNSPISQPLAWMQSLWYANQGDWHATQSDIDALKAKYDMPPKLYKRTIYGEWGAPQTIFFQRANE